MAEAYNWYVNRLQLMDRSGVGDDMKEPTVSRAMMLVGSSFIIRNTHSGDPKLVFQVRCMEAIKTA